MVFASLISVYENEALLNLFGFEFEVRKAKGRKGSLKVDGLIELDQTVIIFEFKYHLCNRLEDPIQCILGRDYAGKLVVGQNISRYVLFGIASKPREYSKGYNFYVISSILSGSVIGGNLVFKENETIQYSTKSNIDD